MAGGDKEVELEKQSVSKEPCVGKGTPVEDKQILQTRSIRQKPGVQETEKQLVTQGLRDLHLLWARHHSYH